MGPVFVNLVGHQLKSVYSIYLGHVDVIVVLIIFNFDEPVLSLHQMAFFFCTF